MQTTTATDHSHARRIAESMRHHGGEPGCVLICAPHAPSTVTHKHSTVSYYEDGSILICATGNDPLVLDGDRVYYRETVELLAHCLGAITAERRAASLLRLYPGEHRHPCYWVCGVCWNSDGTFKELD